MKQLTLLSGTFEIGCSITIKDEKWNIYNLLVVADKETSKPCVELHNVTYFEKDIQK